MKAPKDTTSSSTAISLSPEMRRYGGWNESNLAAYRQERALAVDLVGGNVVTHFQRAKREPVHEHIGRWSPFTRKLMPLKPARRRFR